MKTTQIQFTVLATVVVAITAVAGAVTVPVSDPTYIPHDDLVAWNWQILALAGVVAESPHLPTGQVDWIRMYSNGNPNPSVPTLVEPVISPTAQNDMEPTADWWYGLEYVGNQNPTVSRVLTAGEVLTAIRTNNPNAVTPIFAFDQNQVGNQPIVGNNEDPNDVLPAGWPTTDSGPDGPVPLGRDKWLRARLILVPPSALDGGLDSLLGMTAAEVNAAIDPLIPSPADGFLPGVDTSGVVTFYFRELIFNDFPDPAYPGPPPDDNWTFNWSYLPGLYDPRLFLDLSGYFPQTPEELEDLLPVDNNVGGALADWGGYLPGLDLSAYQDYAFFLSLETKFNNDGKPEAYILGGLSGEYVIPEPLTLVGLFLGIAGVGGYIRRRRKSA